jgi:hypothetical protein
MRRVHRDGSVYVRTTHRRADEPGRLPPPCQVLEGLREICHAGARGDMITRRRAWTSTPRSKSAGKPHDARTLRRSTCLASVVNTSRLHVTTSSGSISLARRCAARQVLVGFFVDTDGPVHASGGRDERDSFYGPTVSASLEENWSRTRALLQSRVEFHRSPRPCFSVGLIHATRRGYGLGKQLDNGMQIWYIICKLKVLCPIPSPFPLQSKHVRLFFRRGKIVCS